MNSSNIDSSKLEKLLTQFHKTERQSEEKSKEEIFDSMLKQLNIKNDNLKR